MIHRHHYRYLLGESVSTTGPSTIVEECGCGLSREIGYVGERGLVFHQGYASKRRAVKLAFAVQQARIDAMYRELNRLKRQAAKKLTPQEREAVGL